MSFVAILTVTHNARATSERLENWVNREEIPEIIRDTTSVPPVPWEITDGSKASCNRCKHDLEQDNDAEVTVEESS